jgi:signal transduction histidine kinase
MLYLFTHLIVKAYKKENDLVTEQKQELELLNATKDKFFSILAHDLRGPFLGIIELTNLMSDKSLDLSKDELQDLSNKVSNSTNSIYSLLENLLNWAKMKQGLILYKPTNIQLRRFASKHLNVLEDIAAKKELETNNDIPNDIIVFADENMLQTILRNLVLNAVKFTNKGGAVSIGAKKIDGGKIEIFIIDNGIGMSKEVVDNLFTLGEQVHRIGTDNEPSSGLGLLLCQEFVSKHNSVIEVVSIEGEGSVFKFELPIGTNPSS